MTLGRSRTCTVVLKDQSVSRTHALLSVHPARVTLQDLNSSNGTYVDGVRLREETVLADGARLTIGETEAFLRLVTLVPREAPGELVDTRRLFCPACGELLPAGAESCPQCGKKLFDPRAPSRSEAMSLGDVLPVGELLANPSESWDGTGPLAAAMVRQARENAPFGQARENAPSNQPRENAPSNQARENAPSNQPRENAPSNQPRENAPSNQPRESAPFGQARESAPSNQPRGAAEAPRPPASLRAVPPPRPLDPAPAPPAPPRAAPMRPQAVAAPLPPPPSQSSPAGPVAAADPAPEPASGELLPSIDDLERRISAASSSPSPPAAPVTAGEARPAPGEVPAAGFGRRLVAFLVDGLLVAGVALAASFAAGGPTTATGGAVTSGVSLLLGLLIPLVGWSRWGTTPGKRLLGLYVGDAGGRVGLTVGQAVLRLVGYAASALTLGVGFLMIAFSAGHRGLHDLIAGTTVVRRR